MVNNAKAAGLLKLPIPERAGDNFPIIQYADDTLLLLEACPSQLQHLKVFSDTTGLKVDYNKSFLVPINVDDEKNEWASEHSGLSNK